MEFEEPEFEPEKENPGQNQQILDAFIQSQDTLLEKVEDYNFGRFEEIEIDPKSLMSDTHVSVDRLSDTLHYVDWSADENPPLRTTAEYVDKVDTFDEFIEVLNNMSSVEEWKEILPEENIETIIEYDLSGRVKRLKQIESELQGLVKFIKEPSAENLKLARESVPDKHQNALPMGYGIASMKKIRKSFFENVRNNRELYHSYISEEVIESILEYYFFRADGTGALSERVLNPKSFINDYNWISGNILEGVLPPFLSAYQKILNGHYEYFSDKLVEQQNDT